MYVYMYIDVCSVYIYIYIYISVFMCMLDTWHTCALEFPLYYNNVISYASAR